MTAVALTIAGSDSGGGAGIEADLKTFDAHEVWGTVALTAVTAQNTLGVQHSVMLEPGDVVAQIESVAADFDLGALKTGMLGNAAIVEAVAAAVANLGLGPLVVDPVLVSKHGDLLLAAEAVEVIKRRLFPLATLVTPNLPEVEALVGAVVHDRAGMLEAAASLAALGPQAVLVKGGHLGHEESADLLWTPDGHRWLEGSRLPGRHTHGTGCVLSAAICARLALGRPLEEACADAKAFVRSAIVAGLPIGHGVGPVNPSPWGQKRAQRANLEEIS